MKSIISVLLCLSLSMAFGAKKRSGLFEAIKVGDKKSVLRFLEKRGRVNAKRKGKTPLMMAARYGKLDIAKILIDKGASINAKEKSTDQTALHIAIYNKHPSIALLLIDHGAFLNVKGTFKKYSYSNGTAHWTPLHLAAQSGQVKVVQELLKAGALVNTMDDIQKTPLHFAAGRYLGSTESYYDKVSIETIKARGKEQLDIVKLLLERGSLFNAKNIDGWTALHYGCESGQDELVKLLIESGANINVQDKDGDKPLSVAVHRFDYSFDPKSAHNKVVKLLINKMLELNILTDLIYSQNAIHGQLLDRKRLQQKLKEQILKSLKKGVPINQRDVYGSSFLHWAAMSNHRELVHILLSKGVQVNATDFMGSTPLEVLKEYYPSKLSFQTENLLRKAGGKINIYKALYKAVKQGHIQVVKRLIKEGAGDTIRRNEGESLVDLAKSKSMKTLIRKAGGNRRIDNLLIHAVQKNKMRRVYRLIRKGANVNSSSQYDGGRYSFSQVSNIHLAVKSRNLRLVKVLVSNGANIHSRTKGGALHGATALHWAVFGDNIFLHHHKKASLVQFLLKKDANLKARLTGGRYQGATPLHLAIQNMGDLLYILQGLNHREFYKEAMVKYKENYRVIQLLIKKGADIHAQIHEGSYKGETPLHWAMNRGLTSVVRLLISKGAKLDSPNHYGMRPLFWALNAGHYRLAERMIQKEADVHVKNKYSQTPLHLAVACRQTKIVKLLIQRGAKINVKDKAGKTPLDYAKTNRIRVILKRAGKP